MSYRLSAYRADSRSFFEHYFCCTTTFWYKKCDARNGISILSNRCKRGTDVSKLFIAQTNAPYGTLGGFEIYIIGRTSNTQRWSIVGEVRYVR